MYGPPLWIYIIINVSRFMTPSSRAMELPPGTCGADD